MRSAVISFGILLVMSCNDHGGTANTTDSVTVNTTESSKADGGPNHGLGDTSAMNQVNDSTARRMNDTMGRDTLNKK